MGIVRACCGLVGGPLPLTFPLQSMMRLKMRFKPALQVALRAILVTRTRIIHSHKIEAIIALISESRSLAGRDLSPTSRDECFTHSELLLVYLILAPGPDMGS